MADVNSMNNQQKATILIHTTNFHTYITVNAYVKYKLDTVSYAYIIRK